MTKSYSSSLPLDAQDLDAFRVFGETPSFVAVAKAMHITQPAAYLRVKRLSASLGVALYRRDGRNLVLTEAGIRTLAHARDIHRAHEALRASLAGEDVAHDVVLATGEGALLSLFGASLARVPLGRARLRVQVLDAPRTLDAVRRGEAHVGVLPLDEVPGDVHARVLARVPFVVILPKQHPLTRKRRIGARDLADIALVVPPGGRPHRIAVERFLEGSGVAPLVAAEAMGWAVLSALAGLGLGVAIVPMWTPLPKGMVTRPLVGFPDLTYRVIRRRETTSAPLTDTLFAAIRVAGRRDETRSGR